MVKRYIAKSFALLILTAMVFVLTACSHQHSYGEWTVEKAPSCAQAGVQVRHCECGEKEYAAIEPVAHTEGDWVITVEPACTVPGSKCLVCSVCEAALKTEELPATGHTEGSWLTAAEPTCTESGVKHLVCAGCNVTLRVAPVDAVGHTAGSWTTVTKATCTVAGLRQQACSDCQLILNTAPISATGHTEGSWITDVEPAVGQEGSKHLVCAVCAETLKTEAIPALPRFVIILDAGHGGADPGATVKGVDEKKINLQVTYKLKELLEAKGVLVILTREEDKTLSLSERTEYANMNDADLFVSVHCNSADATSASGFEVYYYENTLAKSCASAVLNSLKNSGEVKIRSVKTAGFYVLKYTKMPAILLELGFLTNDQERMNLCDDEYQNLLAGYIASSIVHTLRQTE